MIVLMMQADDINTPLPSPIGLIEDKHNSIFQTMVRGAGGYRRVHAGALQSELVQQEEWRGM